MDAKTFKSEIKTAIQNTPVDITLLSKWFDEILAILKALRRQKAGIKHPRHRGEAREVDFLNSIRSIFPSSIQMKRGFIIDCISRYSREQDILLINTEFDSTIIHTATASYYPVESVFGSVEVKSVLGLDELRRAVISCISAKKLMKPMSEKSPPIGSMWYAIFAYDSPWGLEAAAKRVDAALIDVPADLRPDAVYILGKGLLIPGSRALALVYRQAEDDGFQPLSDIGTAFLPTSEAYAFLWFVTSMIEHCKVEKEFRVPPSIFSYFATPISVQLSAERSLEETDPEAFNRILESRGRVTRKTGTKA